MNSAQNSGWVVTKYNHQDLFKLYLAFIANSVFVSCTKAWQNFNSFFCEQDPGCVKLPYSLDYTDDKNILLPLAIC
jgi:hypothetical protein